MITSAASWREATTVSKTAQLTAEPLATCVHLGGLLFHRSFHIDSSSPHSSPQERPATWSHARSRSREKASSVLLCTSGHLGLGLCLKFTLGLSLLNSSSRVASFWDSALFHDQHSSTACSCERLIFVPTHFFWLSCPKSAESEQAANNVSNSLFPTGLSG